MAFAVTDWSFSHSTKTSWCTNSGPFRSRSIKFNYFVQLNLWLWFFSCARVQLYLRRLRKTRPIMMLTKSQIKYFHVEKMRLIKKIAPKRVYVFLLSREDCHCPGSFTTFDPDAKPCSKIGKTLFAHFICENHII